MTYLEFYQAWSELVMQNVSVITIPEISCSRTILIIAFVIEMILIFWLSPILLSHRVIFDPPLLGIVICFIVIVLLLTIALLSPNSECQKTDYKPIPAKIIYEYPDKDYSVQEFEKNMISFGQNVSIEQKELAKLVMQNCIAKSKNVRECIFNSKPTFEKAELERIKFQ